MINWGVIVTLSVTVCAGAVQKNAFLELANSEYYVDKTEFILKFHEQKYPMYFSAPRRFAKTINLSMLKAFYQAHVNVNGEPLPADATDEYKTFQKLHKQKRTNPSIMRRKQFFQKNFKRRPVISISFKELDTSSIEKFLSTYAESISDSFTEHEYLYSSKKLVLVMKDIYRIYTNKFENKTKQHLVNGFRQLSAILTEHYETRCIVLIDDFDTPLIKLLTNPCKQTSEILTILQDSMASLLNDNENVLKVLLTGNLRWAGIYSPFNVFSHPYTKHEKISKFFGITMKEIKSLVNSLERKDANEDMKTIEQYYDGYNLEASKTKLWCPNSVSAFLARSKPSDYWSQKETQDMLKLILRHKAVVEFMDQIFVGKTVPWQEKQNVALAEVESYRRVFCKPKPASLSKDQINFVKQFLMEIGYLKISEKSANYSLVLPNEEVKLAIMDLR